MTAWNYVDDCSDEHPLQDWSCKFDHAPAEVIFENHETRLVDHIANADAVIGCVAWMTSIPVLEALADKDFVSIVVQKEDFLRPESGSDWHGELRRLYNSLPGGLHRYTCSILGGFTQCGDPGVDAVRCAGEIGRNVARCHHKFAVMLKKDPTSGDYSQKSDDNQIHGYIPTAVWVGSYNWTRTAGKSRESVLVMSDAKIAEPFISEWQEVLSLSEPLNWSSPYIEPEWRLGS